MDRHAVEKNARYLVIELIWAAIAAGCLSFNAAFIIRLGGSNLLVSLLTASAALVNALLALPFAAFMERRAHRRPWMIRSLLVFRMGYLGLIFIPWLPVWRAETMVLLLMLLNVPVALFNAGWLPMMADVIPIERRARVFSARNMALGATITVTTFVMGRWLDAVPFPLNYQLMFALVLVTSMLSTLYVARMIIPDSVVAPRTEGPRMGLSRLRELVAEQRPFTNMVLNSLIFSIPVWVGIPLQPIYFVRELGASDGWIGIWLALSSAGAIVGNLFWPRLIDRRGFGWVLLRAALLSVAYYFLIGLFPNLYLILIFALLSGMINPGIEICHFNILLEVCPSDRRATYLGVFVMIMNLGFFFSTLVVAPLVELFGAQLLVLALGVIRLVGSLMFYFNPVHIPVVDRHKSQSEAA